MQAPGEDPKSQLNHFCQAQCKRPVTKEDIVYTCNRFGQQYQAIVKLSCLGGQEYAGNLAFNPKDAEKDAALQALQAYAGAIAALPQSSAKDAAKKRKMAPMLGQEELAAKQARMEAGENPAFTPKVKLNSLCMKLAKRFLQKGETMYKCMTVPGGYQATVQLACLPGEWSTRVWAGHVCANKQKAEQSAAEIALEQIMADKELGEEAAKTVPKAKTGGGGSGGGSNKGWGKGWNNRGNNWGWDWGAPPPWMWQMFEWGGGGWDDTRERISEAPVTGEVAEWKGTYAWVTPHNKINHPASQMRSGRVYVNKKDLPAGTESLSQGQAVKFHVYVDQSGLGGEEVELA
mmetsp:Transcript_73862/g.238726  ORF Transcript_73862/g.238726 Transcript_73862/m.238726 type:complete len:346 (-) Transcript_73862:106-1143(-)